MLDFNNSLVVVSLFLVQILPKISRAFSSTVGSTTSYNFEGFGRVISQLKTTQHNVIPPVRSSSSSPPPPRSSAKATCFIVMSFGRFRFDHLQQGGGGVCQWHILALQGDLPEWSLLMMKFRFLRVRISEMAHYSSS